MKKALIPVVITLIAGFVHIALRPDKPFRPQGPRTAGAPWFELQLVKPRSARPLGGLLPDGAFGLPPSILKVDQNSPGAQLLEMEPDRIRLQADGWSLLLEIEASGGIGAGSRIEFPIELGGRQRTLRANPGSRPTGYLHQNSKAGPNPFGGEFRVEFSFCEDAISGQALDWPQAPLVVQGAFGNLSAPD